MALLASLRISVRELVSLYRLYHFRALAMRIRCYAMAATSPTCATRLRYAMFRIYSEIQVSAFLRRLLRLEHAFARYPRLELRASRAVFFDKLNDWARSLGEKGLGYISYPRLCEGQGPIARNITSDLSSALATRARLNDGDALFFVCSERKQAESFSAQVRERLGVACESIAQDRFSFCWIVDFPMYERDADSGEIVFSHNPFSLPRGGLSALNDQDPLDIVASQYDIVCNGVELSSGALRNHDYASLQRAFAIAGYDASILETRFPGIFSAMRFGVPPHGGAAPGIERIVMLLAGESNIREVTCFPLNQTGQDLLMGAPSVISSEQLKPLGLRLLDKEKRTKGEKTE